MSNNRKCACVIPPCGLYGKTIHADPKQLKKYIHKNHDHSQLVDFAYKIGLIESKNGYHSHEWLLEQFVKLGLKEKNQ